MSATVEEIADSVQDLNVQEFDSDDAGADVHASDKVASRAERKSRKALQGIGLKKVGGITRVTMRRPRGHLYVIAQPEVYKSSHSDVYIVFGEAKAEDMSQLAQAQAAQQMAQAEAQERLLAESLQTSQAGGAAEAKAEEEEEDDDSPIDEEGVDAKDIDLVMQQVSCSRRKAVKALKESNGDLINAIMNAS
ncbi:nascent polypeptide-associated complex, alpha subunit [Moesziomyces antarcticus]|uniref:Related to nascent polypeptide-associated complex alpha chain n=2 Tax=Pseudozyma antarctica TaxID=84753 RepID=A0A5C3FY19_PSEA2|nr:nascent polypeptide-associated complex, alpha subunit [Moesziomyces antarcticus]GAK67133.1 nascent polypeptide-associated complex, alpha subunit [Moesziomyces antarcticus]SPO48387.1 related to nascent polypeptide-associated complex alpha chain [Moesziomyces antarcticus]